MLPRASQLRRTWCGQSKGVSPALLKRETPGKPQKLVAAKRGRVGDNLTGGDAHHVRKESADGSRSGVAALDMRVSDVGIGDTGAECHGRGEDDHDDRSTLLHG